MSCYYGKGTAGCFSVYFDFLIKKKKYSFAMLASPIYVVLSEFYKCSNWIL